MHSELIDTAILNTNVIADSDQITVESEFSLNVSLRVIAIKKHEYVLRSLLEDSLTHLCNDNGVRGAPDDVLHPGVVNFPLVFDVDGDDRTPSEKVEDGSHEVCGAPSVGAALDDEIDRTLNDGLL
jgi:hypothetical protein